MRSAPHRLAPDAQTFVEESLKEEVDAGAMVRGNSPWGSAAFCTRPGRHRRRIVIDYRRVNQVLRRAYYHLRKAEDVKNDVCGSVWISPTDASKGFNLIRNTKKSSQVLAAVSASGCYLPTVLNFGPTNGPEDFAMVSDRVFTMEGRCPVKTAVLVLRPKSRHQREWQIYVDDCTIRTGKVRGGIFYDDDDYEELLTKASASPKGISVRDASTALEDGGYLDASAMRSGCGQEEEVNTELPLEPSKKNEVVEEKLTRFAEGGAQAPPADWCS